MKIGVTGTREGATDSQFIEVIEYLTSLGTDHELHHGDCVGVDIEAASVARELSGEFITAVERPLGWTDRPTVKWQDDLVEVYHDGRIVREYTFDQIRAKAR